MTIIKAMYGTMPIDLHLVGDEDMDRMLKLPSARAVGKPVYIDSQDRCFPRPAAFVELVEDDKQCP